MNSTARLLFLVAACLAFPRANAASQPLGCLIEPHHVAEVGSPVIGIIAALHVERGDSVRRGQVLAVLRSDVEQAAVKVATSRALANAEASAATANAALAQQKLARAEDLVARQFLAPQALDQARAEASVALERLAQTREARSTAERELEQARAQLGLRTIRAPNDGVVADRYLSVGERVEEKPLFRVATIDPLRVEVVLPAALFGTLKPGAAVSVTPDFPGAAPREARVTLIDRLVDGVSNTFRVRLSLPNPGGRLPAGLRCKATLGAPVTDASGVTPGREAREPARSGLRPASYQPERAPELRQAEPAVRTPARAPATGSGLPLRIDRSLSAPPAQRPRV
ncbi:MAG: efflux RND transporter periplasmic adaptor subunit [Burkholderiales bacterium]|nr:efflux RND transporter periplasmic adaptor subunit [Burkholderiales bacterium]